MSDDTPRIWTHADDPYIPPEDAYLIDAEALRIEAPAFLKGGPDDPDPYSFDFDTLRWRMRMDLNLGLARESVRLAARWEWMAAREIPKVHAGVPGTLRGFAALGRLAWYEFRAALAGEETKMVPRSNSVVKLTGLT